MSDVDSVVGGICERSGILLGVVSICSCFRGDVLKMNLSCAGWTCGFTPEADNMRTTTWKSCLRLRCTVRVELSLGSSFILHVYSSVTKLSSDFPCVRRVTRTVMMETSALYIRSDSLASLVA